MMRVSLVFLIFSIFALSSDAVPQIITANGWNGIVESFGKINGVETENHDKVSSKAEDAIKKMIQKHLTGKRKAKNGYRKNKQSQSSDQPSVKLSEPQTVPNVEGGKVQLPLDLLSNLNWEEHKETRDLINSRVPGGTASVDALVKLLQESNQTN